MPCGSEGLSQHLAAKYETGTNVTTLAAKQVVFQLLNLQQIDQFGNVALRHETYP